MVKNCECDPDAKHPPCCGSVPVTKEEMRKIIEKYDVRQEDKFRHVGHDEYWTNIVFKDYPEDDENHAMRYNLCVFLDQETNKCTIHAHKPKICKEYKCKKRDRSVKRFKKGEMDDDNG